MRIFFYSNRKFFTRNGNPLTPPDWFVEEFPDDMSLDGELFGGRGMFQSTVSIVKTAKDPRWKNIRYKIFDTPSNGSLPFEKRMEILQDRFEEGKTTYLSLVEHTKCKGKEHIEEELPKVLARGGEGLMIREPKSKYEQRRSYTLLKIKKFYDAEAVVIGHEKSKSGAGGCGALRCRMECGKEIKVGSGLTNKDRRNPPKIGTIITYKFQEYSDSGNPRFPSYIGVRIDMDSPKDAILPAKIKEAAT
ncbi:DNA ligase-like [Liolophura sinensis]|uniref:DNA ligase-like n=1 Tax=Liolophura sinensis TaxID=3198878 RepID=UPI003158EBDD